MLFEELRVPPLAWLLLAPIPFLPASPDSDRPYSGNTQPTNKVETTSVYTLSVPR